MRRGQEEEDTFFLTVLRLLILMPVPAHEMEDILWDLIELFFFLPLGWKKEGAAGGRPAHAIVNAPPAGGGAAAGGGGAAAAAAAPPPPPMRAQVPTMGR